MEVTGSESPSTFGWNRNNRARQDLSRARLRAIKSSLENGQVWVPPSPAHRKSWEEEVTTCLASNISGFSKKIFTNLFHCLSFIYLP